MSTVGQIVGTIVGIVIGFYTGGAGWALVGSVMMGAAAGYAVGSAIDPTQADLPSPGQSQMGKLDITLADEGVVIYDGLGTFKVAGNVMAYGRNRMEEETEEVEGGKGGGGSTEQKVGEKYFLTWAQGICLGPVDELYTIFKADNVVWQGNLKREDSVGGVTAISISGMGTVYFFFGTNEQTVPSSLEKIIPTSFLPHYRGLCWAFFDDCLIGAYNRAPTMKFVVRKTPEYSWSNDHRIGLYDYSPAHALWYIIDTTTELPVSMLHTESFSSGAEALGLEGRGISLCMGEERQAITYLENILTHVGGIFQFEADGLFHFSLMRNDVDKADMISYGGDDFVEEPTLNRKTWQETINDVKVQFAKRVDRPYEEEIDPVGNPDVYTIGFIDESTCANTLSICQTGKSYTWDSGHHCIEGVAPNSRGTALPQWNTDKNLYFDGPSQPKTKEWLLEGAVHISVLLHVLMESEGKTGHCPIAPATVNPALYVTQYDSTGSDLDWAAQVSRWKAKFINMVDSNPKGYIPGSVLNVYVDTSSLGGISALQPAYGQFKTWVQETYGGLLYIETEDNTERWLHLLHRDLTPFGYGRTL